MSKTPDRERLRERRALGERLALLRGRKGWSQDQIAQTLGVRRPTVTAWEGGDSEPLGLDLQRLADLYGVAVEVLTGRAPLPPPGDDDDVTLDERSPADQVDEALARAGEPVVRPRR